MSGHVGTIEVGAHADLITLDHDPPRAVGVDDIADIRVTRTWIGGVLEFEEAYA